MTSYGCDGVSNHQPRGCLLNRLFRRRSKKTSKLRVTGLCAGNSPGTGEFPAQMASNAEMFPFDDVIMYVRCRIRGIPRPGRAPHFLSKDQEYPGYPLQWRHERDGVSTHRRHDCLFNRLFRRRSKKTSKLRVTGLCERNYSPAIGEFPAKRASNAENVSILWRHHVLVLGQGVAQLPLFLGPGVTPQNQRLRL